MTGPIDVLYVGRDSTEADHLQRALRAHPGRRFSVAACRTLAEALDCLQERRFALTLLSLDLPDSQGVTTFARLRAAHPHLAVVVLTDDDDDGFAALASGAQDRLRLGQLDGGDLVRRVRHAAERSRLEHALTRSLQQRDDLVRLCRRALRDPDLTTLETFGVHLLLEHTSADAAVLLERATNRVVVRAIAGGGAVAGDTIEVDDHGIWGLTGGHAAIFELGGRPAPTGLLASPSVGLESGMSAPVRDAASDAVVAAVATRADAFDGDDLSFCLGVANVLTQARRRHEEATGRQQAEAQLQRRVEELTESRARLAGLFDNALDAILLADDQGALLDANPAACSLTGYGHDELIGMHSWALNGAEDDFLGLHMWQEFLDQGAMSGEYSIIRRDGTVVETEFRAVANVVDGVHLSILRPVPTTTARRRAVDFAVHELRTPLALIATNAELLADATENEGATREQRELAAVMARQARKLLGVVGELLPDDASPGTRAVPEATDLVALTRSVAESIDLGERRLLVPSGHAPAAVDATKAELILSNLLRNAARHTPADAVIRVEFEYLDDSVRLSVADDGPGVPPGQREAVFDAFWQGSNDGNDDGSGLGLALVRRLATLHGGRAWVTEADDGGAKFMVELRERRVGVGAGR